MLVKSSFFLSILALVASISVVVYVNSNHPKLAYVDSALLVQEYEGMQDAVKAYQTKAAVWQANIDTLAAELSRTVREFEKNKNSLGPNEVKLSQELIQSKRAQFLNYKKAISEKAQGEDEKMTKAVMEEINAYVKRYGEQQNFEIIVGANQTGNLVYAKEGLNITKEVLESLNAEYQQTKIIQD